MKLKLFLTVLICASSFAFGQDKCNCTENLEMVIQKVEENYAGFPDKIHQSDQPAYEGFKKDLKTKAATTSIPSSCYLLLKQYVNFFHDKHFRIEYNSKIDSAVVQFDMAKHQKRLERSKGPSIEGFWTDGHGTKIAIVKRGQDTYKAIKLSSDKDDGFPKGFVYFTLTENGENFSAKLYNLNINIDIPAKQIGNFLKIWSLQLWAKENTTLTQNESEEFESWKNGDMGLMFKTLNADFSYLKIPTFENNDGKIQNIVAQNDSIIKNTKYLIIDLTGNGGGSSGWVSLVPYIATDQINQGKTYLRVSKENVAKKIPDLEMFVNNPIPEGYEKYFPEETLNEFRTAYRELPKTTETFHRIPSVNFPLDSVLKMPTKVAVIIDGFGGSSTEYFLQLTKQSKKVVSYGKPTIGMMDYVGMSIPTALPYDAFKLYIPIEKSSWTDSAPIDSTGFIPQIIMKEPQENWIAHIMNDLPKR